MIGRVEESSGGRLRVIGRVEESSGGASTCDWEGGGIIRGCLRVIGSVEESSGSACDREGERIIRGRL